VNAITQIPATNDAGKRPTLYTQLMMMHGLIALLLLT